MLDAAQHNESEFDHPVAKLEISEYLQCPKFPHAGH